MLISAPFSFDLGTNTAGVRISFGNDERLGFYELYNQAGKLSDYHEIYAGKEASSVKADFKKVSMSHNERTKGCITAYLSMGTSHRSTVHLILKPCEVKDK